MKPNAKPYLIAALLILAGTIGYWLLNSPTAVPPLPSATPPPAPKAAPIQAETAPETKTVVLPVGIIADADEESLPPTLELQTGKLPWEEEIDKVLAEPIANPMKARALFALIPHLPPTAWERATEEAVQRVPNADYNVVALPLLINPQANTRVLSILFEDVMSRPESLHLPALLSIARMPGHPFAEPAHDNLSHTLGQNFANDWAAWDAAVRQRLAQQQR